MSLASLIPYVRSKMNTLGYSEHRDEFDLENIPSTVIDKTYSIQVESLSVGNKSHVDYEWSFPLSLYVFYKGYNNPSDAMDGAIGEAERIMTELFEIEDRFSVEGIRKIEANGLSFSPMSQDNDTIIRTKIELTGTINIYYSKNCL